MKKILLGLVIFFSVIGSNSNNLQGINEASKMDDHQFTSISIKSETDPGAAH